MTPIHLRNVPPPLETFNHVGFICFIAEWLKPEHYLELGVRDGVSLIPISKYCQKVTGVDITFDRFTEPVPSNTTLIEMSTDDFFKTEGGEYDLVFIDALHESDQVYRDFLNVKDKVIEEGFIVMHDTSPFSDMMTVKEFCSDCWLAALKIKQNHLDEFEMLTLPFNPGVTILKKINKDKQIVWK